MKIATLTITAAIILSGCSTAMGVTSSAMGATNLSGESSASKRAAVALGVSESDLTISNFSKSGVRTDFMATTSANSTYNCYITNTMGVSSDAICTPLDAAPAPSGQKCNALLEAAGKC